MSLWLGPGPRAPYFKEELCDIDMAQGVFESMRSYQGKIFELDRHIQRLYSSCKAVGLRLNIDSVRLKSRIALKFKRLKIKDAYIRIAAASNNKVSIIIKEIYQYPDKFYKNGVSIITSSITRNCVNCLDPQIKSGNFLNGIFAKTDPHPADSFEQIMLNQDGYITECTVSNIFIIKQGGVYTPPCSSGVLGGVTRHKITQLLQSIGFKVAEQPLTRFELYTADEVFLTNTSVEIMPVVSVDKRIIADGKPGKITKRISRAFKLTTDHYG